MQNKTKQSSVYEVLRAAVLSGRYPPSRPFPSERALATRHHVSRSTVHCALADLEREGLIFRSHGCGTFITKQGALRQIGLIMPGIAYSEFFQPIATALSALCTANDYGLSFMSAFSKDGAERAAQTLKQASDLVTQRVRGVIFQPIESLPEAPRVNKQILAIFKSAAIPVILLDSDIVPPPERSSYDVVGVNNFNAGRMMAVHLISAGAKRIRFAMMPHPCYSIRDRFAGMQSVLAAHGEPPCSAAEIDPCSEKDVRRLLRLEHPDAILCCCDTFAAYLKQTLESLRKKVPDQILLAGFDDVQHASLITPSLTTMRQPCQAIAETAFRALMERIAKPDMPPREILLQTRLTVRDSTRRHYEKDSLKK